MLRQRSVPPLEQLSDKLILIVKIVKKKRKNIKTIQKCHSVFEPKKPEAKNENYHLWPLSECQKNYCLYFFEIAADLPTRRLLLRIFLPLLVEVLAKKPLLRFLLILLLR